MTRSKCLLWSTAVSVLTISSWLFQRAEAAAKRAKVAEEEEIRKALEKKKRRWDNLMFALMYKECCIVAYNITYTYIEMYCSDLSLLL